MTSKPNIEFGKILIIYVRSIVLLVYGSDTTTQRNLERIYLGIFKKWCWKENGGYKIVRESNEVTERIGEKTTLLNNILCRKSNWIGHILRRNCLLHDVIEEQMMEVKE